MKLPRVPYWLVLDVFVTIMLVLLFETMRLPSGMVRQLGFLVVVLVTFGGMGVWVALNAATLEQEALDEMGETDDKVPHQRRWTARTVRPHDALK